ncbi:MAG: sugar phosphate isomerase/epimerase [Clostridia bacterium]|nr:sugar phosphate isomerase/epimerase [Clostridia bacterium]
MKTSIFSLPSGMSFHEAVDYAKTLGLDAIEPYPSREFARPDVDEAKRLKEYADEMGVGISCFSMAANIVTGDRKAAIEELKGYADVAAAMGSPYLHHTLLPVLNFSELGLTFREAMKKAVEGVREISDYAAEKGIQCLYEDQGFYFNGVQRFDDFLGKVNRNVGVVADLGNILFVGEEPEAFTARFAPLVKHVHVKDYLRKDSRWPNPGEGWYIDRNGGYLRGTVVGHGTVNFQRVFSVLQSVGYEGYFSLEYDGMEDAYRANKLGLANMKRYYEMAKLDQMKSVDVHL